MKVLILTPEWPDAQNPNAVPFLVRQVESMKKLGFEMRIFYFRGGGNPLHYLRAMFRLWNYLIRNEVDLIHAQWGQGAIPAYFTLKPLIITYRGSDLQGIPDARSKYGLKGKILVGVSKFMSSRATEIITVSEKLKSLLKTQKPVHVIPSGIDFGQLPTISKAEARKKLGISQNTRLIFFPSNPKRSVKRYDLALAGVQKAKEYFHDLEFHFADGFTHETTLLWIKASDIVLFTSSHEGSPNVIKESLALNTPIISTKVGDVPQFLENLQGSVLLENTAPDTLAEAIHQLLNNPVSNYDSKSRVIHLDEQILSQQIAEIYRRLGK